MKVTAVGRRWRRLVVLAGALCFSPTVMLRAGGTDSEGPPPVAIVESVEGKPLFATVGAKAGPLDPARDIGRLVHSGDILNAPARSSVRLRLQQGPKLLKGPSRWVAPAMNVDEQGIVSLALQRLEAPAEAVEAIHGALFSPAEGSSVRPDVAPLRWQPTPGDLTLRLKNERSKVLWSRDAVAGMDGKLDDPVFNTALRDFRESVSQGKLTLEARSGETVAGKVEFSIISEQAEISLKQELKVWGAEPEKSLLRYVGRAAAFGRRFMWNEEADELEAAVAAFPKSLTLLKADQAAQVRTGNTSRAEALQRLLSTP